MMETTDRPLRYSANEPVKNFSFGTYFGDALLLTDMQARREDMLWVRRKARGEENHEVVLYLGCNVHKTINIVRVLTDLFDAMGFDYGVVGGPSSCCGIIHSREGESEKGDAITKSTWTELGTFRPQSVVMFCPSSRFHFMETKGSILPKSFEVFHITEFLVANLNRLPSLKPINRTVALHGHTGHHHYDSETAAATKILQAIPGLDVIVLPRHPELGRHCTSTNKKTMGVGLWETLIEEQFREAKDRGAENFVTISHECQRLLYEYELRFELQVENFVTLLGESAGIVHEDLYRRCMRSGDLDEIYEVLRVNIEANHLKEAAVRDVIRRYFVPGIPPDDYEV